MTATAAPKISFTFDLPHSPDKVWRALTDPTLVSKWLMATDMGPLVGTKFTFKSQPTPWWNGIVECQILELEPNKRLRYTWRAEPLDTVVSRGRWRRPRRAPGSR